MIEDDRMLATSGLDVKSSLRLMHEHADFLRRFIRTGANGALSHDLALEYLGSDGKSAEQIIKQLCHFEILLKNDDGSRYYLSEAPKAFFEFYHGKAMGVTGDVLRAFVGQIEAVVVDIERHRYGEHIEELIASARSIIERVNVFVRDNRLLAESQIADARANGGASEFRLEQLIRCLDVYVEPIARIFEVRGEVSFNLRHLEDLLISIDSVSARDLRSMIRRRLGEWRVDLSSASISLRDAVAGIKKAMSRRFSSVLDLGLQTEVSDIKLYKSAFDGVLNICVAKNEFAMNDELIRMVVDEFFGAPQSVDEGFVDDPAIEPEARLILNWSLFRDSFLRTPAGQGIDLLRWLRDEQGLGGYDSIDVLIDAVGMESDDEGSSVRFNYTDKVCEIEFEDLLIEHKIIEVTHE